MVIKNYSVTLNEENVIRAKEKIKDSGGKLSPILDLLLTEWLDGEEEKKLEVISDGNTE